MLERNINNINLCIIKSYIVLINKIIVYIILDETFTTKSGNNVVWYNISYV